jgi:hypothetical protein
VASAGRPNDKNNNLHASKSADVIVHMKKALVPCLLICATALLMAQQGRIAPGRVLTGSSSHTPAYAPYEVLSVFPEESGNGTFAQVDPNQLQSLAGEGWQLVSVAPYAYRNEGAPGASSQSSSPPPPLITQVYLAYFFQRSRLIR